MSSPDAAAVAAEPGDAQPVGDRRQGAPASRVPADSADPLPPALSSMWRLCRLGFRYEPALMGVAFVLALAAAVPDALLAGLVQLLRAGLLQHHPGLPRLPVGPLPGSAVSHCAPPAA